MVEIQNTRNPARKVILFKCCNKTEAAQNDKVDKVIREHRHDR